MSHSTAQPPARPPFKVGEILVQEGYLTPDALGRALDIQREQEEQSRTAPTQGVLGAGGHYKPLGLICVELGFLTADELQRVLRKYNKRIRLGELLVNQRLATAAQIGAALQQQQKTPGQKLGAILVAHKILNESQLLDALCLQLDVPRMIPSMELVDSGLMDHFPLDFYRTQLCLPLFQNGRQLTVVMADPLNEALIAQLEKSFRAVVQPALATATELLATLKEYERYSSLPGLQPLSAQFGSVVDAEAPGDALPEGAPPGAASTYVPFTGIPLEHLPADPSPAGSVPPVSGSPAEVAPTVGGASIYATDSQRRQEEQVVSFLIKNAMKDRASDIHIEPQEQHIRIRYRIDGVLYHKTDLPAHLGPPLLQRLKELLHLNPAEDKLPQRGRSEGCFNERDLELGLATYPSLWGETLVLSLQEKQSASREVLLNIERIGFSPLYQHRSLNLLSQPGGLMILTGPARSGKSTTLYAAMNYLNQQNRSIITAENPVELRVPGTVQGAWAPDSGQSFADMIQSMCYLDPDILMVSEIDGPATLEAVVEAALSGAKVLTSFPAFDATGALLRLNRMGLENYLLASSQVSVLSQRLVRRLCQSCKQPHRPSQEILNRLGLVDVDAAKLSTYRPVGCATCNQHGYTGQTAIHELLQLNEAVREAVLDHKPAATIRGIARTECKLVSMAEDGLYKAMEGITSIEEVQRVAFVNEYDAQTPWEAEEIYQICRGLSPEYL